MKLFCLLLLQLPWTCFSQSATIHFDIKNATAENLEMNFYGDLSNPNVLFGEPYVYTPIQNGKLEWSYQLKRPATIKVYYISKDSLNQFTYSFFLTPGDDLYFSADEHAFPASIVVTGKGSENNQPMIQSLHDDFDQEIFARFMNDTLPHNALKAIENKKSMNQLVLNQYLTKYSATAEFIKNETTYLEYFTLSNYSMFKGSQKFSIRDAYERNEFAWQSIEDSLIQLTPLTNDTAIFSTGFAAFISTYLNKSKERLWMHPELIDEYCQTENDKLLVASDPENILKEKIIEKHLSGKSAEFLYALFFPETMNPKEDNLVEIFIRFIALYPTSEYIPFIEPRIFKIIKNSQRVLDEKMILVTDSISSFEEVLELVKGKTVLLDMWGTWCRPCRSDLMNHSESIKNYFKNKPLDYLYIANHDVSNEQRWKELIAYYGLSGMHILASNQLTDDIMKTLNQNGFPSYVIIKKDGSFELYEGTTALETEVLFQQIDRILKADVQTGY